MTDVDWGTEDNQAKPKKRVPTWLWIGGGCCGIAVLGLIGLTIAGVWFGKKVGSQDANWAEVAEVLPYDPSAREERIIFEVPFQPGVESVWTIQGHGDTSQCSLRHYSAKRAEGVRRRMFEERDTDVFREMQVLKVVGVEVGTIDVQGRELRWASFLTFEPDESEEPEELGEDPSPFEAAKAAFKLAVRVVDVTPEGRDDLVLLQYNRMGTSRPATDEEIRNFLAPYHVGPNR